VDWDHVDLRENVWQNLAEDADGNGHTMERIVRESPMRLQTMEKGFPA